MSLATRGLLELAPRKAAISTKYAAGAVLVIGGAAGMTGAPQLAGLAAMRSGAGLVWLAVPEPFAAAAELMVRALPEGLELAERADAVVLGPGLGRADEAGDLARRLARRHRGPMVIDADALFALSGRLELTARRRVPAVLTPHEGELGRLLERDSGWVRANRMEAVRSGGVAEQGGRAAQGPRHAGRGAGRRPRDRLDLRGPWTRDRRLGRRALGRDRRPAGAAASTRSPRRWSGPSHTRAPASWRRSAWGPTVSLPAT